MTKAEEVNMLESELKKCGNEMEEELLKSKISLIISEASKEEKFFDNYGTTL